MLEELMKTFPGWKRQKFFAISGKSTDIFILLIFVQIFVFLAPLVRCLERRAPNIIVYRLLGKQTLSSITANCLL